MAVVTVITTLEERFGFHRCRRRDRRLHVRDGRIAGRIRQVQAWRLTAIPPCTRPRPSCCRSRAADASACFIRLPARRGHGGRGLCPSFRGGDEQVAPDGRVAGARVVRGRHFRPADRPPGMRRQRRRLRRRDVARLGRRRRRGGSVASRTHGLRPASSGDCGPAASLPSRRAAKLESAPDLVFWQPVISGRQHLQQFLRLRVAGELIGRAGADRTGTNELRAKLEGGATLDIAGYALVARRGLGPRCGRPRAAARASPRCLARGLGVGAPRAISPAGKCA